MLISVGFAMAAAGDMDFNPLGFAYAVVSVTMLCLVNFSVKKAVAASMTDQGRAIPQPDPKEL